MKEKMKDSNLDMIDEVIAENKKLSILAYN